jgi:hypothetical protein
MAFEPWWYAPIAGSACLIRVEDRLGSYLLGKQNGEAIRVVVTCTSPVASSRFKAPPDLLKRGEEDTTRFNISVIFLINYFLVEGDIPLTVRRF